MTMLTSSPDAPVHVWGQVASCLESAHASAVVMVVVASAAAAVAAAASAAAAAASAVVLVLMVVVVVAAAAAAAEALVAAMPSPLHAALPARSKGIAGVRNAATRTTGSVHALGMAQSLAKRQEWPGRMVAAQA